MTHEAHRPGANLERTLGWAPKLLGAFVLLTGEEALETTGYYPDGYYRHTASIGGHEQHVRFECRRVGGFSLADAGSAAA